VIVISHVAGLATIQDRGRPGRMHEGLAPGGALVPELLALANRAVDNPDDAPALELFGRIRLRAEQAIAIGTHEKRVLAAGEEVTLESGPLRVAYIALRGGIDAPLILGGRGTQLSAGIGAALRAGDHLTTANTPSISQPHEPFAIGDHPVRVIAGPDVLPDALAALLAGQLRIAAASDRVGTRLDGVALPAGSGFGVSRPMIRGAIELPPDGHPIVLGPEHPTTGGYPVIAVVVSTDQGRLFATPLGAYVRFTEDTAR